jgi:hypothetical protein
MSSILSKNELIEYFNFCPSLLTGAEIFRSFFGRIEKTKSHFEFN